MRKGKIENLSGNNIVFPEKGYAYASANSFAAGEKSVRRQTEIEVLKQEITLECNVLDGVPSPEDLSVVTI